MNTVTESQNAIRDIINEAQYKISELVGLPVTLNYKMRFNHISVQHIFQIACKVCDVYASDIISQSRKDDLITARMIITWMCKNYCGTPEKDIAKLINRDRTTVIKNIETANGYIDVNDASFVPLLKQCEAIILKKNQSNEVETISR